MKRLMYGLTVFCLMLFGMTTVNAQGSVNVSPKTLNITEGGSATFKITVDNALARANISSSNNAVITVNEAGLWVSDGNGKGKTIDHTITVNAVGTAGTTAKVIIELFDASTYDGDSLATKTNTVTHEVTVNVVAASVTPTPTPNTYTVTFNANGGTGGPSVQTKTENVDLTLSSLKPTKDKYTFVEWNTKKDGSGTSYAAGGKYTANANVTLYAIWQSSTNVDKNPQTGDSSMWLVLAILITFGGYAYWYTKKAQEN